MTSVPLPFNVLIYDGDDDNNGGTTDLTKTDGFV